MSLFISGSSSLAKMSLLNRTILNQLQTIVRCPRFKLVACARHHSLSYKCTNVGENHSNLACKFSLQSQGQCFKEFRHFMKFGSTKLSLIASFTKSFQTTSNQFNLPPKEPDPDAEEKKKQQMKQIRAMRWTLLAMFAGFTGFCVYAVLEWGKPSVDDNGHIIEDRFSHMPTPKQNILRALDAMVQFKKVVEEPARELLLPPPVQPPYYQPPYTLVLEMTSVLVHPEWTYKTGWRFKKRPFIDYFLQHVAPFFEIVIYTQDSGFTAFPLLDSLDPNGFITYRLFRDSTRYMDGVRVKDLNCLNRDLRKVIHIDWCKDACKLNPQNCLIIKKWEGDSDDKTLFDLAQFLAAIATQNVDDIREVLRHYSQFDDPVEAFKENQRRLLEQEEAKKIIESERQSPSLLSSFKRK